MCGFLTKNLCQLVFVAGTCMLSYSCYLSVALASTHSRMSIFLSCSMFSSCGEFQDRSFGWRLLSYEVGSSFPENQSNEEEECGFWTLAMGDGGSRVVSAPIRWIEEPVMNRITAGELYEDSQPPQMRFFSCMKFLGWSDEDSFFLSQTAFTTAWRYCLQFSPRKHRQIAQGQDMQNFFGFLWNWKILFVGTMWRFDRIIASTSLHFILIFQVTQT